MIKFPGALTQKVSGSYMYRLSIEGFEAFFKGLGCVCVRSLQIYFKFSKLFGLFLGSVTVYFFDWRVCFFFGAQSMCLRRVLLLPNPVALWRSTQTSMCSWQNDSSGEWCYSPVFGAIP